MISVPEIENFFSSIREDNRIYPVHISLFMAVIQQWGENKWQSPICVFSKELMQLAKISSNKTYHKSIRELHAYGYLRYEPSFNRLIGSLIYIV